MTDREGTGRKRSTFLVTHADEASAVLRDVTDGQVHALAGNPDLDARDVLEATLEPEPPMEVTWRITELTDRRSIPVEESPESPTRQARELAADQSVGEMTRQERAGEGEIHVITVPEAETEAAAADVVSSETTVSRAARLGVDRVEVRAEDGVVSVRYLP